MKTKPKTRKRVLVAMSGGVDSSVAAYLLHRQGYEVVGVTMCFGLEDAKSGRPNCCSPVAIEDAKRVADTLGIGHYVLSFGELLQKQVIDEFLREYTAGRTPNPCIRCNQFLKFDALLRKAQAFECDYLATGHYARIVRRTTKGYLLQKARYKQKDQSYFLYRIPRGKLPFILFPIGNLTKPHVRAIARRARLPVADKPGSQDVCFIQDRDLQGFLRKRLDARLFRPGPIKDDCGRVLGHHQGILFYTIGQRQGLGIAHRVPLYVKSIDVGHNTLIVGEKKDLYARELEARDVCLTGITYLAKRLEVRAKIRYNHPEEKATVIPISKDTIRVIFSQPQWAITPGQSVVLYQKNVVVGGATIDRVLA